jgi:hypothetical protein
MAAWEVDTRGSHDELERELSETGFRYSILFETHFPISIPRVLGLKV